MRLSVTHFGAPKREQEKSQDAARVEQHEPWLIAALADGVGASRGGGEAAQRSVAMVVDYFHARPQAWSARRALGEFVSNINHVLHQESLHQGDDGDLLSTLSVAVLEGGMLVGLNVGDSPVYLWRQGVLRRLTRPHVLEDPGMEHVLTQAIGMAREVSPWYFEVPLADGDVVLLCSDGVERVLPPERLSDLLGKRVSARALVRAVTEAWPEHPELRDDATAVVIDVTSCGRHASSELRVLEVIPSLQAGDRHDGYVLEKSLHEGGRVWLARDKDGGRHVLKFAPLEAAEDEVRRDAFFREGWHASRMDAPEFVHARVPLEGSLRYYVIEYVEAPTLREILDKGRLRVEEGIELARFLLRSAQYLLTRDHVHGDIKPENILVHREGGSITFRMIDFGSTVPLFGTQTRAGTPSYLAPERFVGSPVSERSEIYSIGATLYEALGGTLPYGEIERFQSPSWDSTPRRLSLRNFSVPAWLDTVIMRSLLVDPAQRYQTFSEMSFDLANPGQVQPLHQRSPSLLVRNPLLFFKVLSALLFGLVVLLCWLLAHAGK